MEASSRGALVDERRYHYTRYNQHDVLRVNWIVWLILLYMTRHTLLVVFLLFAAGRGGLAGAGDVFGARGLFEPLYMVSDLPALVLICAIGARLPQAGDVVRAIWRRGKSVILGSIAIYFVAFFWKQGVDLGDFSPALWVNLAANLAIAVLVIWSRYLSDLFAQFPARPV